VGRLILGDLTNQIFGEPDPAIGSDIDTNAHAVKHFAGQMDAMPAGGWLMDHAFLNLIDIGPGQTGWASPGRYNPSVAHSSLKHVHLWFFCLIG
jgi:hypothetical protein